MDMKQPGFASRPRNAERRPPRQSIQSIRTLGSCSLRNGLGWRPQLMLDVAKFASLPPTDNDTRCNDPSGYKHPILDLDPKDVESLNEHMQRSLPPVPQNVRPPTGKTYYFNILIFSVRAASVGSLHRGAGPKPRATHGRVRV